MKTFKAKDLYIVKPIKIEKEKKYYKFDFPYNILYNLGFLEVGDFNSFVFADKPLKEKLKLVISKNTPKYVVDSAISTVKQKCISSASNISIATSNSLQDRYNDIFTDDFYEVYSHDSNNSSDLIIMNKCHLPIKLSSKIAFDEFRKPGAYTPEIKKKIKEDLENHEYTLDELKKIKELLVTKNKDEVYNIKTQASTVYTDSTYQAFSFDSEGNRIYPISNLKVKKKTL